MATYTTTSAPLPYVEPYLQDYLSRAMNYANQGYTPSPSQYTDPNQALQTGWQAATNRATQGSPTMGAANTLAQQTMQGQFMNNNPYLSQSIQNAQGDLAQAWNQVQKPQWDKAMANSGSFGNTGVMQANEYAAGQLQQNMARIGTDMRNNAYNTERQMMQNAMGMAPTFANQDWTDINAMMNVGNQQQAFANNAAQQNYQWWNEAQKFPLDRLNAYGTALGIGGQGQVSTQQQPDPSTLSTVVGGALTGASLWNLLNGIKP